MKLPWLTIAQSEKRRAAAVPEAFRYRAHGLSIASDRPIHVLDAAPHEDEAPNIIIRRLRPERIWAPRRDEFVIRDASHLSVAQSGNRVALWAYCGTKAQFERAESGQTIVIDVYRPSRLSGERFEHTLLHVLLPNALVACGATVLHAASIMLGGRAYLFAGDSGMGKSTLAAGLGRRGHAILAEDIVCLDWDPSGAAVTYASYPGARLRSNSFLLDEFGIRPGDGRFGLPKHRVLPGATPVTRAPFLVGGLFVLARCRRVGPELARLRPTEALPAVLQHSFLQPLPAASRSRDAIARAACILRSVPVFRVAYRRSPQHFDRVLDRLIETVLSAPSNSDIQA